MLNYFIHKFSSYDVFLDRIYELRRSIFLYSFSSILDLIMLLSISSIFNSVSSRDFSGNIVLYFLFCLSIIAIRTIAVFLLRRYSFKNIFMKKVKDENHILFEFIHRRKKNDLGQSINVFKEKIINSCNLAVINFDIPVVSIFAELIFGLGGIFLLINIFGIKLILLNLPIFILLILISRLISKKLKDLGNKILDLSEKRLNSIDNIAEIAEEISALDKGKNIKKYFSTFNHPYNKILSEQIISSNLLQISTESSAFVIILISLICIVTNITETSLANSATSLAILSRMVPSFTRSIAFITQLQFGLPCVRRLSSIKTY